MSFNLRADFNFGASSGEANAWISTSGNHRRDLVTTVINASGPDILGVQEAFNNQVIDLQNALPSYGFYGVGRNNGAAAGEYSGIFFRNNRFTQTNQGTFWLSLTPDVPSVYTGATFRIASWVILKDNQAGGQEYFALNSHWAQGFEGTAAREYSAGLVRDRVSLLADDRPLVVMGDLNAFDFQPAYLDLLGQSDPGGFQLQDSYREISPDQGPDERTNHGFLGHTEGQRIDYILHSNDFHTEATEIVHTSFDGFYPSDHYPITSTLILNPAGDYNFDGVTDGADFLIWQRSFGLIGTNLPADGDDNGIVNVADYNVWQQDFGSIRSELLSTTIVPEPSASLIVASLVFSLILFRERVT